MPELARGVFSAGAFGLAALDHPVDLATWIATDERGSRIEAVCRERGVALMPGSQSAEFTSVAHATLDATGAATYVFDLDWQLPTIPDLTAYGHVHTGSIAAVIEPGGADVRAALAAARATGATVSYDPNARPSLMGAPAEDADRLHDWSMWIQRQFDPIALSDEAQLATINDKVAEFYAWVRPLIERRRSSPSDDLISALIAAEQEGDRLSGVELENLVLDVLVGGVDTSQSQLAHALRLLAERNHDLLRSRNVATRYEVGAAWALGRGR